MNRLPADIKKTVLSLVHGTAFFFTESSSEKRLAFLGKFGYLLNSELVPTLQRKNAASTFCVEKVIDKSKSLAIFGQKALFLRRLFYDPSCRR